jgi:signal transduction histidine kinase/Tfp pilus assembly protein PilF
MRKNLLSLVFFFTITLANAQQHVADSLEARLPHVPDLRKIEILNDISRAYWSVSLEKSREYANEALRLAEKIKSRKGMADAYNRLGNVEYYKTEYNKALEFYLLSTDIRLEIEDYPGIIASYNNLAIIYNVFGDIQETLKYYHKALDIARQISDPMEIGRYCISVGNTYALLHKPLEAKKFITEAKEIYEKLNHATGIANAYRELGNISFELMDFNTALEYHISALSVYEQLSDTRGMADVNNNIGSVYWKLEKNEMALEYYLKAYDLYQNIPSDKLGNASTLNNIGNIYHNLGELNKALEYYMQVLAIYEEIKSESGLAVVYHNIGMIQMQLKDYEKALESYFKSVEINKKRENKSSLANNFNNIGELYLLKEDYHTALDYLKKSAILAEEIKVMDVQMENYLFQSRIYSHRREFSEALDFHKRYTNLKDSIFGIENQNRVLELQVRFEAESKQKVVDVLKKTNQLQEIRLGRQRNEKYFYLAASLLILILVFFVYNRYRFKKNLGALLIDKNKQLEIMNEKLRISEKELLTINATKDKFFSIIAHDLKNPFNALLSFSEMLHNNLKIFKKDEIKAYVEIIHKATNNLFRLLENLLQWSSTQTGEIEYRPDQFDLNSLTMNIIQIMSIHAEKKGISIINSLPENASAYGDKNLVSTVIRNLLSNAVKFTRENGQIRIEGIIKKDEIEIAVIDNGIGINKVDIDKLFRLDCNVTTIGTSEERGSGLGLILCKEFVEKNGGRIWVESEIDIGSSFKFTIPKNKKNR